ncbi:MAG: RES family NAD+ phosphorylase [Proteobacteria bacterium]|nr:RES family NAD+ phosphorylase [Pseudomonadota bacterium]
MIEVFRLGAAQFTDSHWKGEGGLHVDGRWHVAGRRIVYTAQSLSLAQLEVLVHIADRKQLPKLALAQAMIPDDLTLQAINTSDLPPDWRRFSPYSDNTQRLGMQWLATQQSAVLKVPSAISDAEWNYLLNPLHPDFKKLEMGKPKLFVMDPRVPARQPGG